MPGQSQWSNFRAIDANGRPLFGALLYVYEAGTTTPKTPYAEYSLATPISNPLASDGFGMFPAFWLDDSESPFYRVRMTDKEGNVILDYQTIQIFSVAESGGTPPEPVDVTGVADTGSVTCKYGTSQRPGWRIMNGTTIGSATSGADYANIGAEGLFLFLWQEDSSLAVSGGRGANAAADWAANKRIALPNWTGRIIAALDTMGGVTAGTTLGLSALGSRVGQKQVTLTGANIPEMTLTMNPVDAHTHTYDKNTLIGVNLGSSQVYAGLPNPQNSGSAGGHTPSGKVGTSSPTAVATLPPIAGGTWYIKL